MTKNLIANVTLAAVGLSGLVCAGCGSSESATAPPPKLAPVHALPKQAFTPALPKKAPAPAPVPAPPASAPALPVPVPPPPAEAVPPPSASGGQRKPVSPVLAWEAIERRLARADRDSTAVAEAQLAGINEFFAGRKRGARPFAQAVLGMQGKFASIGCLLGDAAGGLDQLLGGQPHPPAFSHYAREQFGVHVFTTRQLQKAIDRAVAGYAGDVRALEGRLLVDLRADLDDAGFDFTRALPVIRAGKAVAGESNAMISQAIDAAAKDFSATIVKFAVSTAIGNAVGDRLTSVGDSGIKQLGINFGAGVAVDKVLDEGIARAGYDPESALAAKVTAALDRMRVLLIEGNARTVRNYSILLAYRDGHPDQTIRSACREATNVMERGANLGLRRGLLALHAERSRFRKAALRKLFFGDGAPVETVIPVRIDPEITFTPDEILKLARQYRDFYGVRQP